MLSKVTMVFSMWTHDDGGVSGIFNPIHQRRQIVVLRLLCTFSKISELRQKEKSWGHSAPSKIALTSLHFSLCDNLKAFYDVGFIVI